MQASPFYIHFSIQHTSGINDNISDQEYVAILDIYIELIELSTIKQNIY